MCKPSSLRDPNLFLEHSVQRLVEKHKEAKDDDPVIRAASRPQLYGSVVRCGTPIYVSRSRIPVILFSLIALTVVGWSLLETNLAAFAISLFGALAGYDLLSGFLHIVFDDPANLPIPILGQPCLEFQMHHNFPMDLVQRNFLDVLGDLNTVVVLLAVWNLCLLDFFQNPVVRYMGGLKLFMAYYGQFSHRSAHDPKSERNRVICFLRAWGLMISVEQHRSHHRPPHDNDFCLVGVCNPIINFLFHHVTRNRWFWMAGFTTLGLGGIAVESILMEKLLRFTGLVSF